MKKKLLLTLFVLAGICWNVAAQSRGSDRVGGEVEIVDARRAVAPLGKQWAVFIAIDEYREWEPLQYPVRDAREIKDILLEHYYIDEGCVRELYNRDATRSAILSLFAELNDKTGPDDSVFVFHAGHGTKTDDRTRINAWIPYDGGENISTQSNWLSHLTVRSMLDALNAKHVFLISDSCFSGDLLYTTRGASSEIVVNYPAAYNGKSRQAMSSGASENVDDVSEFASRLKITLLRTETPYLTPDFIYYQIRYVETETVRPLSTIPLLAAIPQSQHVPGGSFLFFRKNPSVPQPDPEQNPAPVTSQTEELPPPPPVHGTREFFVGSWVATVEYNGSYDTYEITLSANGRCTVKITNDTDQQEAAGNWSFDEGTYFRIENVTFRNPAITYQRNIRWASIVVYGSGNNSFNIMGRAATNGPPARFTFYRE